MSEETFKIGDTIASVLRLLGGVFMLLFAVMKILDDTQTREGTKAFAEDSLLFGWFYGIFASSDAMLSFGVFLVIFTEIVLGLWLLSGFMVRLSVILNFAWILFLLLSWLPDWATFASLFYFLVIYGVPLFFNPTRWAFLESKVPEKFMKYHKK